MANTEATLAEIGQRRGPPAARLSGTRASPLGGLKVRAMTDIATQRQPREPGDLTRSAVPWTLCLRGRDFPMML